MNENNNLLSKYPANLTLTGYSHILSALKCPVYIIRFFVC